MRIPFLTRLLEIKEQQLLYEFDKMQHLRAILDTLQRIERGIYTNDRRKIRKWSAI